MKIVYDESLVSFQRDFKKLEKKYKTLLEDFAVVKKAAIELLHLHKKDNGSIVKIKGLCNQEDLWIYKVRKIACKSLKGKGKQSGLRIIYVFIPSTPRVIFLEIYHKNNQKNESRDRIKHWLHNNLRR